VKFQFSFQKVKEFFSLVIHLQVVMPLPRLEFNQKGFHVPVLFAVGQGMVAIGRWNAVIALSVKFAAFSSPHQNAFLNTFFFLEKDVQTYFKGF
jgi:hypothetical protein